MATMAEPMCESRAESRSRPDDHCYPCHQRLQLLSVRALERDGLVTRTAYPSVPRRVEYALTDLGLTLLDPVLALASWAIDHRSDVSAGRERQDAQ
jgi:DNA-binding HxlR family transcriptional regulator